MMMRAEKHIRLLLLIFFVLLGSISRDAFGRMQMQQIAVPTDSRVYRSLSRKILAVTGSVHREVINAIVDNLLDNSDGMGGGEVFLNPINGEYHIVKGMPRGSAPFSNLAEHLAQQSRDGYVFGLRRDGFSVGKYLNNSHEIIYEHHRLQLNTNYFFVGNGHYQDLQTDLLTRIKIATETIQKAGGNTNTFMVIEKKLVAGKKFNLFDLLKMKDSIVATGYPELSDIFESFYYASVERSGIDGDPDLQRVDARITKLAATTSSNSSYLSFYHEPGWNREEFENYLLGKMGEDRCRLYCQVTTHGR